MRAIEKQIPVDSFGQEKIYARYQDARGDLIDQLGDYCSYCGMKLNASLAVEHVQPKNSSPNLALNWSNFLLACTNCNSTKGSKTVDLRNHYWPDLDNTSKVFVYGEGGTISAHPALKPLQKNIAVQTLALTGLNKRPGNDPTRRDRRWSARMKAWDKAQEVKQLLAKQNTSITRKIIIDLAIATGFWSVWVAVFADDSDMLSRLSDAFPGTYQSFQTSDIRPRL